MHFLGLLLLRSEDDQLRIAQCILEAGGVVEGGEDLAGVVHARGSYTRTDVPASESWRVAHVVRVRLECLNRAQ